MNATELLERLTALGVTVTANGDKLRLEPASRIPPAMMEELRANKPAVIAALARRPEPAPDAAFSEVLAVLRPHLPRGLAGLTNAQLGILVNVAIQHAACQAIRQLQGDVEKAMRRAELLEPEPERRPKGKRALRRQTGLFDEAMPKPDEDMRRDDGE